MVSKFEICRGKENFVDSNLPASLLFLRYISIIVYLLSSPGVPLWIIDQAAGGVSSLGFSISQQIIIVENFRSTSRNWNICQLQNIQSLQNRAQKKNYKNLSEYIGEFLICSGRHGRGKIGKHFIFWRRNGIDSNRDVAMCSCGVILSSDESSVGGTDKSCWQTVQHWEIY